MTGSICEHVTDVDSAKTFAAIELSKASWLVALHLPSHDKISVFQVPGGDVDRLLAIRETALGESHPDVAATLNNLATVYKKQGRLGAAQPLYERALAGWEKVLGPDHPATLAGVNNLTDKRYYTRNVDGNAGRMVGAPRMVYVQGRYAF